MGNKFYDANANGVWDKPSEPGIAGWRIYKQPPVSADQTDTTTSGQYSFLVDKNSGLYNITEGRPSTGFFPGTPWINTTAISGNVTVADADVAGPDFGNVCLGAGGGLTLGFWSNNNGQNLINAGDLTALQALNLRNANGSNFDPTTKGQVKTWLLSANATNMAYMLSAQLAAMTLNVRHNLVNGNQPVYAQGIGFITINNLMSAANTSLGLNGYTVAAGPVRTYQEQLKTALDKANNNLNFVLQPANGNLPCEVPSQWQPFPPTS